MLIPGGTAYISVPDLDILCELFISKEKLGMAERFFVMQMMFRGHIDQHDYHIVGLNQEFLTVYLLKAGFRNIQRVASFGLFDDTSIMDFKRIPISLNMVAQKLEQG